MRSRTSTSTKLRYLFLLVILILLAAFFRWHQLDTLPPGLYHDEAFNGLDALRLLDSGRFPLFFAKNGGREPLHIYLQAVGLRLLGTSAWSLRFVSTLMSILTVPLVYRLGQALFHDKGHTARQIGLLAAAALAFSYWHITFSRMAFRAVFLLPLLVTAVWLFWRGWQRQRYDHFVASGVALGLSLYTYLPSRLLALFFAAFVLLQLPQLWRQARGRLPALVALPVVRGSVVTAVFALLVFSPLGLYFWQNPDTFFSRSSDVSIFEQKTDTPQPISSWQALGQNTVAVSRMFIDQGDSLLRHNLPGRPSLNWLEAAAFLVGVGLALINMRQPAYRLLLLLLVIMLLPTLLATEAPHSLRAIGALPAVVILVALGIHFAGAQLARFGPPVQRATPALLLVLLCLVSGGLTYRDYFQRWASNPGLPFSYSIREYALAQRALSLLPSSDLALPLSLQSQPTFLFLTETRYAGMPPLIAPTGQRPVTLLTNDEHSPEVLNLLRQNADGAFSLASLPPLDDAALAALEQMDSETIIYGGEPMGKEIAAVSAILPETAVPAATIQGNFDNKIELVGYTLRPSTAQPGDTVWLTLYWQSNEPVTIDYNSFAHLTSYTYTELAKQHQLLLGNVYPTSLWQPGDSIVESYEFIIPEDAEPAKYQFDVGLFNVVDGARLPVLNNNQENVGDHLLVGAVTVADAAAPTAPPGVPTNVTFGPEAAILLQGYDLVNATLPPGGVLEFTLHWQAQVRLTQDYTIFVHIVNEAADIVAQQDIMPGNGRYRTSLWFVDENIRDVHQVPLPPDLPPGRYQIGLGLYFWATGERLPAFTASGEPVPDARLILPTAVVITE